MIGKLLGFAPWWAWLVAASVLLGAGASGGYAAGRYVGKLDLATEKLQSAQRQADAVMAELKRGNETADLLRKNHAEALERADAATKQADAASAAAAAAHTMARRVRDASATDLLAARAAIQASGATAACGPALDAADLRQRVLEWCEGATRRLGSELVGVAAYAGALKGDDAACRKDYATVTR